MSRVPFALMIMAALEITDFTKDVLDRSHQVPVVADFWAEWCGPCRVLGPVLESLAERSGGAWVLAKVDTDRHQDIAARYGIRGIPNVKLFVDGEVVDEFTGALPQKMIEDWLVSALPDPSAGELDHAEQLIRTGSTEDGIRRLEEILSANPAGERARVLLAEALVRTDPRRAVGLVAGIEEDSEFYQKVSAVRTIAGAVEKAAEPVALPESPVRQQYADALTAIASGDYDGAIERLIDVIRDDRDYDDDGARRACVALFTLLGDEDPVTSKHRRTFARALNV